VLAFIRTKRKRGGERSMVSAEQVVGANRARRRPCDFSMCDRPRKWQGGPASREAQACHGGIELRGARFPGLRRPRLSSTSNEGSKKSRQGGLLPGLRLHKTREGLDGESQGLAMARDRINPGGGGLWGERSS